LGDLPDGVRQFLRQHVSSVMHLEVLLRLRAQPDVAHEPGQLSRDLGGSVDLAIGCLAQLERSGLAARDGAEDELCYVYAPKDRRLAAAVDEVADTYARRKVAVVTEIFRAPDDPLRDFSEAFRVRKRR